MHVPLNPDMRASLELLIAVNILTIVLGSPLGFSNQNNSQNPKIRGFVPVNRESERLEKKSTHEVPEYNSMSTENRKIGPTILHRESKRNHVSLKSEVPSNNRNVDNNLDPEKETIQIGHDQINMGDSLEATANDVESDNDSDEESEDEYYDDTDYFDGSEEEEPVSSDPDRILGYDAQKEWSHHDLAQNRVYQKFYTSNGYQGRNPNPGNPSYISNRGYQDTYPNRGYEHSYSNTGNQGHYPNRGYEGYDPNHVQLSRGYGGNHHKGYQGNHKVYQGYPIQGYKGDHPNRVHQGNYQNLNNIDPNCDHADTSNDRENKESDGFVDFGVTEAGSNSAIDDDNVEEEISEYPDSYYDNSEYEDKLDDESDPEVQEELSNVNKDHKTESNEEKKDIKTDDSMNLKTLNDESSSPKSSESSENNESKTKLSIPSNPNRDDFKCTKTILTQQDVKNVTDTIISEDCISETLENSEGNKTGRLLDIFTRTNFSVECMTPKNESGQCKSFSECPIRNIVDNYNLFLQYMCLRGVFVGICCPNNPVLEISDSDEDITTDKIDVQQPPEGCGLAQNTRIVGGTISAPHEWTWMVALLRRNRFFCGGVIINDWYVLTAAHCVLGVNLKDLKVRLGEYNFMERTDHQHDINVADIKRHALFVTATFQHDIALLKLKQRIEYSKFIGTICLPVSDGRSYSDQKATVVGWGTVSFGGAASPVLRQVTVPVWENEDCDRTYSLEKIDESFLCAGSTENGEDACQGDSGGPLMTLNSDNRWEVIGIVSWGRRCGDPTYPGVYTRVTSYLDWIAAHAK